MKCVARHLFTLCSAASLLLCVAACVLWVRSLSGIDYVHWRGAANGIVETWRLESAAGRVGLSRERRLASVG